ncbi:hypothetical protein C5S42_07190 [Candidatus Methanomarinus sp.]|nr:hypothetical protein C5S42_07190 [ANME-2 cluster archaeon]
MTIKALIDTDNAVSDIVGFMLVLSIMIVSLAAISLFAQPILNETKDEIYFSNMEQSFTLLHSDTNDIASGRSTIKTRDLNIANAHMSFDPDSTNISIIFDGSPNISYNAGSIEYDIKDRKVCLENGALLSSYGTGSIVISEPLIYTDGQTTVINLVQLDGPAFSVGGEGIVRIIQQNNFTESFIYKDSKNVTITINSQYAGGWAHYLEKQGFNIESITSDNVTASINRTLRIYGTRIKISSEKVLPVNPPVNSLSVVITTPLKTINIPNTHINVTINNTGNQNINRVYARMVCNKTWNMDPLNPLSFGDISAGSSKTKRWNLSTNMSNNRTLFTVTVNGSGNSRWINPPKYQTRSNQINITRN